MRRIFSFSVAGLVALGMGVQTHAGLFDCFKKDTKEASCAAPAACATQPVCTTQPNGNAHCATQPGCTTTSAAPAKKKGGLFSWMSKDEKPAANGCAPQACATQPYAKPVNGQCATQPCANQVCEPSCAAPEKKKGGLFSWMSKDEKPAAGCATEPNCAYPSRPCATNPVCVSKPGACTTNPISVGKPVCGPQACSTTSNGCATTACGTTCAPISHPMKRVDLHHAPHHKAPHHVAPHHVAPHHVAPHHVAPAPGNVPAEKDSKGDKDAKPLPPAPPEPAKAAYYPTQQDTRTAVQRDRLSDLFGLPN